MWTGIYLFCLNLKEAESHYEERKEEISSPAYHETVSTEETKVDTEDQSAQESSDRGNVTKESSESSTSVLGAIGETLVEIAQTTKELVIGDKGDTPTRQQKHDT